MDIKSNIKAMHLLSEDEMEKDATAASQQRFIS